MKVACFLNSPYLGGAERSFILQVESLAKLKQCEIDFVIPYLEHSNEAKLLIEYIESIGFSSDSIHTFQFNKRLFSVSRSWPVFKIFSVLQGFISTLLSLNNYSYDRHRVWWVNGNKIGFVCLMLAYITGFKGKFIWHFRDYPVTKGKWRLIWSMLKCPKRFRLQLIGNSYSVTKELAHLNISEDVVTLYNPVQRLNSGNDTKTRQGCVLGVVSMMAPWKGLHEVILFIGLYETELMKLGVDAIHFYGGDLYKTDGEHSQYFNDIQKLKDKLKIKIIDFKGLCDPKVIFNDIDFLIHSSTRPEPFGRVILEAMASGIPVISSGLGGAKELIEHNVSGVFYDIGNIASLLNSLQFSLENRDKLMQAGKKRFEFMTQKYHEQLALTFKN